MTKILFIMFSMPMPEYQVSSHLPGEKGLSLSEYANINESLLIAPEELDIIKKLSQFTNIVAGSAKNYEPHRVAVYLMELVSQFHSYYNKHR